MTGKQFARGVLATFIGQGLAMGLVVGSVALYDATRDKPEDKITVRLKNDVKMFLSAMNQANEEQLKKEQSKQLNVK